MKALQITPTEIHPPKHGSELRSHGIVSAFPSHGGEVIRFCQRSRGYPSASLRSEEISVEPRYREIRYSNLLCELTKVASYLGYPSFVFLDSCLRRSPPKKLRALIDWADIILIEEFWQVAAVNEFAGETPIVYSTQAIGIEYLDSIVGGPIGNWFYSRAKTLERQAITSADMIICEHEADKDSLEDGLPVDCPINVYHNGVPASDARDSTEASKDGNSVRQKHGISEDAIVGLFVGSNTDFNLDAARHLIPITEQVSLQGYDYVTLIVGSVGEALDETPENVIMPGYVDDLEAYYDAADVGLNSLTWGTTPTGSNIKMIEYLSRGLPVVATEYGASGYDVTSGENVMVGDIDDFDKMIVYLCENEDRRRELGQNALRYVRETHTWETISGNLYQDLKERFL